MISTWIIVALDIFFVLMLGIGFWIGAARGVKRSLLELLLTIVGVIIVGFITIPITNAILGIQVSANGTTTSLDNFLVQMLTSDEGSTIAKLVGSSETLQLVMQKLPSVLFCAIIFLVLNLVMRLIVYVIYKIIAVCAFKTKKKEKEKGLKRNRWAGGLIGTVKMFVIVLVIFMPLTSLIKLADSVIPESNTAQAETSENFDPLGEQLSSLPPVVKQITSGLNKSAFGVLNGAVGLDDYIFDSISQFEIKGEKVMLRNEIATYLDLYHDVCDIYSNTDSIENVNWDNIDKVYNKVAKSGFYKDIVLNIAGELVVDYPTLIECFPSLKEVNVILADVKDGLESAESYTAYLSADIDHIYKAFTTLGRSNYLAEVMDENSSTDAIDAIVLLATKYNTTLSTSVGEIVDMNIVHDAFSSTLDFALEKITGESDSIFTSANTTVENWDTLKTQITNVLHGFGEVGTSVNDQVKLGEIFGDFKKVLKIKKDIPNIFSKLGEVLDNVDNMEIMTDRQGQKLLPQILSKLGVGNILAVQGQNFENYEQLFSYLSAPAEKLLELDLYDTVSGDMDMKKIIKKFAQELKETYEETGEYSTLLEDTILPLYKMDVLRNAVMGTVVNESAKTGFVDFSKLEVQGNFDASYKNWENDLKKLEQIITELESDTIGEQTMLDFLLGGGDINELVKSLDDNKVEKIITPILETKSTEPLRQKLSDEIISSMGSILGEEQVTLSLGNEVFSGEDPQTDEIVEIFKAFIAILQKQENISSVNFKDLDPTLLGKLLEAIKQNAYRVELQKGTTQGTTRQMFDAMLHSIEDANTGYNVNLKTLFKVNDYSEIDFTKLFDLVSKAADAENKFSQAFWDVVVEGDTSKETVEGLIDAVKENEDLVNDLLDLVGGGEGNYDIDVAIPEDVQKQADEKIKEMEENGDIPPELAQKLKDFLGGHSA